MSTETGISIDEVDWRTCVSVLRQLVENPEAVCDREEIERLIARIYKKARRERRKRSEIARNAHDRDLLSQTAMVRRSVPQRPHEADVGRSSSPGPPAKTVEYRPLKARSRTCYICKQPYREVHHFYHLLCPACAEFNFDKRHQTTSLSGRRALVTGGRIKIGYQTALKLLRDGAEVAVTTRFPKDAALRYAGEPDFGRFGHRLTIHGVDFRDVPGLVRFVAELDSRLPALDVLVNNAAQSVKRSADYYGRLSKIESETTIPANLDRLLGVNKPQGPSRQSVRRTADPDGKEACALQHFDVSAEAVDLREQNSWTSKLHEIEPVEFLEVFLVNSTAPSLLTSGLKPLLQRSTFPDRYVINVTGADGQFRRTKSTRHPHVNMSKAALNMMTRTAAADYALDGIYMNSVDTGWITHEGAFSTRTRMRERGFVTPLDAVDGAARICDPVVRGVRGERSFGQLLKNYQPADW